MSKKAPDVPFNKEAAKKPAEEGAEKPKKGGMSSEEMARIQAAIRAERKRNGTNGPF